MSLFSWTLAKTKEQAELRAKVATLEEQRDAYARIIKKLQSKLIEKAGQK